VRVVAPPADFPVGRFTRDAQLLERGYRLGCEYGARHLRGLPEGAAEPGALAPEQIGK